MSQPAPLAMPARTDHTTRKDDPMPPIAREGWVIILLFVLVLGGGVVLLALLTPLWLSIAGGIAALLLIGWCVWFFRDPQRPIPVADGLCVCAADGLLMRVEPSPHLPEVASELTRMGLSIPERCTRVVTFLNVFNVHVNRTPIGGTVLAIVHGSGGFAHAGKPHADQNQRVSLILRTPAGHIVVCTQLVGLIARRIICRARVGQSLRTGERYGLIRFGSRTDLYLPEGTQTLISPGQRVRGGADIAARLP